MVSVKAGLSAGHDDDDDDDDDDAVFCVMRCVVVNRAFEAQVGLDTRPLEWTRMKGRRRWREE